MVPPSHAACDSTPAADEPAPTTTATERRRPSPETNRRCRRPRHHARPAGLGRHRADAVTAHDLPALAIAHIAPGDAVDVAVAGHRSRDSGVILSEDLPFHLGSDTKAMTAVLLARPRRSTGSTSTPALGTLLPDVTIDERIAAHRRATCSATGPA